MDPAYRDRAPQLFVDTDGKERLRVEGKVLGGPRASARSALSGRGKERRRLTALLQISLFARGR